MTTGDIIIAALFSAVSLVILWVYIQRGRLLGAAGWILLLGGQIFLTLGGGEAFPWGGLAGIFVSLTGLLFVFVDIWVSRRRR